MVRYQLCANLAARSAKVARGKKGRSDFDTLPPLIDWPATLAFQSNSGPRAISLEDFERRSKALTTVMSGAQRTMSRLHRHQEPLAPGLPPPSPVCPWCDLGCDEDPRHLFWSCDAFSHIRQPIVDAIEAFTASNPGDLPFHQWEKTFLLNGICPEDAGVIEWLRSIPSENDYPPFPVWVPSHSTPLANDNKVLIATDGGTDFPNDRRFRHSGIGVSAGPGSSWSVNTPLFGSIQMNDKAEGYWHHLGSRVRANCVLSSRGRVLC